MGRPKGSKNKIKKPLTSVYEDLIEKYGKEHPYFWTMYYIKEYKSWPTLLDRDGRPTVYRISEEKIMNGYYDEYKETIRKKILNNEMFAPKEYKEKICS